MEKFKNIGLVAAGKRDILPGTEFDSLFPKPDYQSTIVDRNGSIEDTMLQMGRVIGTYYKDAAKIAPLLRGSDLKQTCSNIWSFIFSHIQYELDEPGEEQLRRPARAWADRKAGVDCDCYSIFASCILVNLGIPFKLRITKYDGKPYFQHVYVLVPHANGNYIIDPVLDQFNYEKQFSGHKDFTMENLGIPIAVLHGVDGEASKNTVMDSLLSGTPSNEKEIYDHLVKTRETIMSNPGIIDSVDYTPGFLQMLDYAIDNFWRGPEVRAKAFEILALNEAAINQKMGITEDDLDGLNDDDDDYLEGLGEVDTFEGVDDDEVYPFDGLGKTKKAKERKEKRQAKKAEKKAKKAEKKSDKKDERKDEKNERKQERKQAKGFFRKIGVTLKQGGKAFVKLNPVVIASRNGFLVALRLNMFKMASRLKWGYATPEQIKAAGISTKRYEASKRALAKVENLFDKKLQGSRVSLKNAILSGKHNLSGFDDDYMEFAGLGVIEEGAIVAAMPVIYEVIHMISQETAEVDEEEGEPEIWDEVSEMSDEDLGKLSFRNVFKKKDGSTKTPKLPKAKKEKTKGKSKNSKSAEKAEKESWIKKTINKISKNKSTDVQKAYKQVEAENPVVDEVDDTNPNPDPKPDNENSIWNLVKSNPIPTAIVVFGLAYAFIPPVRNGVNDMLGVGKKKQQPVNGLGKVVPGTKQKKLTTIKFK